MKIISLKNLDNDIVFGSIYGLTQTSWNEHICSWSFIGNPRTEHGLMYINCEKVRVVYKNKNEVTFSKGDILYVPKYCEYYIEFFHGNEDFQDIQVNFDIRNTSGEEFRLADKFTCLTSNAPQKIIDDMKRIEDASINIKHPCIRASRIFYELLDELSSYVSIPEMPDEEKNPVYPAVAYLDNHVRDNISVPQLAKMCLLSESTFRKAFKAYTGMTPIQYRTHIKICKAQQLLRSSTEISVQEVAESLGFFDNTYFHKMFAKFTGQTPKQYREQCLAKRRTSA